MTPPPFPALLECSTGRVYPLGAAAEFEVGRVGRDLKVNSDDKSCSRQHFKIVRDGGRYFVAPLTDYNATLLNGQAVAGRAALAHEATIRAGESDFRFLLRPAAEPQGLPDEDDGGKTVTASPGQMAMVKAGLKDGTIRLKGTMLLGRDVGVDIPLSNPQVSRHHARITPLGGGRFELRDLGSANGTFVNGRRMAGRPAELRPGDRINIGPYSLVFTGAGLEEEKRVGNIELVAAGVSRRVMVRPPVDDKLAGLARLAASVARLIGPKKELVLLDGVTLVFKPHEFVCLLGPSGSGKSTLMTILSGRGLPDKGTVALNDQDLHANFDALKKDLALVPQKDVLHDSLTVEQALRYTARLRLPPDTTPAEAEACIGGILDTVALSFRRGTVIRQLSGGQIKRACLANEILCKPNVLFLDEVTSGLDERTDSDMMDLFRQIAHAGKTVVCITHSLANVERTCDLVVILTPGGKLAFVGSPAEAKAYFRIDRLGVVYDLLEKPKPGETKDPLPPPWRRAFTRWAGEPANKVPPEKAAAPHVPPAEFWQAAFRASPEYKKYVAERLPPDADGPRRQVVQPRRGVAERAAAVTRQATTLTRRYLAIWKGDVVPLLAMAGQSLVVAILLAAVFKFIPDMTEKLPTDLATKASRSVNLLFLLAVSSFWFGCNNAAKEIVKERTIFTRECDFNLLPSGYFLSKLGVLCLFSFLQTMLLYAIVWALCRPPGNPAGHLAVLLVLAGAGTALGLLISTLSSSEEMAITLIPMVVIPQIILSGAISPLSGFAKVLAQGFVTTYWGKSALDTLLPEELYKAAQAGNFAEDGPRWGIAVRVVFAHALAFVSATMLVMLLRDRRTANRLQRLKKTFGG